MFKGIPASEESIKRSIQNDLKGFKLPKIFDSKVDMDKVNRDIINNWVATKVGVEPGKILLYHRNSDMK